VWIVEQILRSPDRARTVKQNEVFWTDIEVNKVIDESIFSPLEADDLAATRDNQRYMHSLVMIPRDGVNAAMVGL